MKQVKKPRKPLIFYYGIVLLFMVIFNMLIYPGMFKNQIEEVDYGTFLTMLKEKQVSMVQMEKDYIYFVDNQ